MAVAAPASAEWGGLYAGGHVGYMKLMGDRDPAGSHPRALVLGVRGGLYSVWNLALQLDTGLDLILAGPDFDTFLFEGPLAQVGLGVGGDISLLSLQVGLAPFGVDNFDEDATLSILNPRIGAAYQLQFGDVMTRLELHIEHFFRLAGRDDVTAFRVGVTIGFGLATD